MLDHGFECLIDIDSTGGASLDVLHASVLEAPRVNISLRDLSFNVGLVADANEWESFGVLRTVVVDEAVSPVAQLVE